MKRFVLWFLLLIFSTATYAATKTWTGLAADNKWSTSGNWDFGTPVAGDDVVFSISDSVQIDVAVTIRSLSLSSGINVEFACNTNSITRRILLTSILSSPQGLTIAATSTLHFETWNTAGNCNLILDMTGSDGVSGEIFGVLTFEGKAFGNSSGNGPRLETFTDATHKASLLVRSGASIIYYPESENTSATPSTLTMENGSVYEIAKNGGSFPDATWQPNSKAKVTGMAGNPPTFIGISYGNLEWNAPGQSAVASIGKDIGFNDVNLISTGSPTIRAIRIKGGSNSITYTMTVNGNLTLSANSLIEITGGTPPGGGGILQVKGNIVNNGTITEATSGLMNRLVLIGTSNQNISGTGSLTGNELLFVMNGAGATLLSPLTLPANLTLTSGKIKTTATNILTMVDNAIYTGGSTTSFIEGPMKKTGDDNFSFPVGVGSIYAPIGITNVSIGMTNDEFTAEYIRANPQSVHGTTYQSPINHASYVEYWTLDRNIGSISTKLVSLAVNFTSFCFTLNNTFVSRYDGTKWTYEGSTLIAGPTSPPYVSGTITSVGIITSFTPNAFTLSTDLPFISNPLPINLISFDASKLNNTKSSINWELAACCSAAAKFEIQRAGANKSFTTIGTVGGSETSKSYNYIDNDLKNGINYYRLKMIDADGKITYSRTVAVMNGINGLLLTSLFPTIVTNTAELTIASSKQQKLDLVIVDMQGRVMLKSNYMIATGNTNIELSLERLAAGVYQLTGICAEGKTNTIRFIK